MILILKAYQDLCVEACVTHFWESKLLPREDFCSRDSLSRKKIRYHLILSMAEQAGTRYPIFGYPDFGYLDFGYPESAEKWVEGKSKKAFLHFLPNFCHI